MWPCWMGQEAWMVKSLHSEYWKGRVSADAHVPRATKFTSHPHPLQGSLHLRNPIKRPPSVFWELSIQGSFIRGIKPESMQLR